MIMLMMMGRMIIVIILVVIIMRCVGKPMPKHVVFSLLLAAWCVLIAKNKS